MGAGRVAASILVVNKNATNYCTTLILSRRGTNEMLVTRGTGVEQDNYLTTNIGTVGTCVMGNHGPRSCMSCTAGSTTKVMERSLLLATTRGFGRIATGVRGLKLIVLGSRGNSCMTEKGHGVGVGNRGFGPLLTGTIRGTRGMSILGCMGVASLLMGSKRICKTINFSVVRRATCVVQTGTILTTANKTTKLCGPGGPKFSERGV